MTPEQRSRDAYAREHGLDSHEMAWNVLNARADCLQARLDAIKFEVSEPAIKGVFLGVDNWDLTPEEAEAVDKAFSVRNGANIPATPCPVRFEIKDADRCESFDKLVKEYYR